MNVIRTYTSRFIFFILALQILNLSVYGNEFVQTSIDKDGNTTISKNQIDCFVEYIVEEVVTHRNIFPEHKGNHTKNNLKEIRTPIQLFVQHKVFKSRQNPLLIIATYPLFNVSYDYLYFKEINPPPPKAV